MNANYVNLIKRSPYNFPKCIKITSYNNISTWGTYNGKFIAFSSLGTIILRPSQSSLAIESSTSRDDQSVDILENDPTVLRRELGGLRRSLQDSLKVEAYGSRLAWSLEHHRSTSVCPFRYQNLARPCRCTGRVPCFPNRLNESRAHLLIGKIMCNFCNHCS